jgi:Reverse transcriptase (RNA-dependent DNA polymerase).
VLESIQGHPDSGEIWQSKINDVITSYRFQAKIQIKPCLYRGMFKGQDILICGQVGDMLIAGKDGFLVKQFAKDIATTLKITCDDHPSTHFNGPDILQTRDGIHINCSTYIDKLRKAHG